MKPSELKEIFGKTAIQTVCREKTNELNKLMKQYTIELDHKMRDYARGTEEETEYFKLWIDLIKTQISNLDKDIDRWQRLYNRVKDRVESDSSSPHINAEEVKDRVQIIDLLGKPEWQSGNRAKYKCPLHEEKTASFTVYLDQNSYCCYGCNKTGDVIELYMAMNNCDFRTALKNLKDF